jgi:hypothetical protein
MEKKGTEKFTLELLHCKVENCHFVATRYQEPKNLALLVENDNNETVAVCSVNPSRFKGDNVLCVKEWSENQGMLDFLVKQEIVTRKHAWFDSEESGFVIINAYELGKKGKELFAGV